MLARFPPRLLARRPPDPDGVVGVPKTVEAATGEAAAGVGAPKGEGSETLESVELKGLGADSGILYKKTCNVYIIMKYFIYAATIPLNNGVYTPEEM